MVYINPHSPPPDMKSSDSAQSPVYLQLYQKLLQVEAGGSCAPVYKDSKRVGRVGRGQSYTVGVSPDRRHVWPAVTIDQCLELHVLD